MEKHVRPMKSLSDLPAPILVLEVIGLLCLVISYLALNDSIQLPAMMIMNKTAYITLVFIGIGCMIPAICHIAWRAIHQLSMFGIDRASSSAIQDGSQKKDEKN